MRAFDLKLFKCVLGSFVLISVLALSACGAHNSAPTSPNGVTNSASVISSNAALAECNNVNSSIGLTGQVTTYYQAGEFDPNVLLLNVTAAPLQLYSSNTAYIEIIPYTEVSEGAIVYGPAAQFEFMDILTGQTTTSTFANLSYPTIQAALKQLGLTSSISASQFFSRVYVVMLGMDSSYQAASVEYFDTSRSSTALSQSSFLLPIFYANPAVFEEYSPVPDLEQLHPFWTDLNNGYSDAQFGQMDESICQAMAGGGRIPASVGSMDEMDMVTAAKNLKGFWHTKAGARFDQSNFMVRIWVQYLLPVWHRLQALVHTLV